MVSDNTQGLIVHILGTNCRSRGFQQVLEQINLVVGVNVLHHCSDTLQAHTGINRRFWQRCHFAIGTAVVLHEYNVPDLDVTITIFFWRTWRAAPYVSTMIEEDLSTRTTRAGITHRPEVIFIQLGEALWINTDFLFPDALSFIVRVVYGYPKGALSADP